MRIAAVSFQDFPPFADAIIEFPQSAADTAVGEVQLLTGQNGTGKTRLLCLLAAACGGEGPLNARIAPGIALKTAVVGLHGAQLGVWQRKPPQANWLRTANAASEIRDVLVRLRSTSVNVMSPISVFSASQSLTTGPDAGTTALAFRGMARVSDAKISSLRR